jgi:2-oxoisovalerate dehydrogenase E1 component
MKIALTDERPDLAHRTLPPQQLLSLYRSMLRIRLFEERTIELFKEGLVKGTAHLYIGQEAIAPAVCACLEPDDYIASNHRGHGHCIAKGAHLDRMMAELMGRSTGYCGGLGGSMHIADLSLGILGANGIVGASMPIGSGAALSSRLRGSGQVAVAFLGDGASNQGVFHETMNLAAAWSLPMVFVCENNQYALTTPFRKTVAGGSIARRAAGYGVPGVQVDGNDVEAVYFHAREAVERARAGEGPSLIEALTYRYTQHSIRMNLKDPRPADEVRAWTERDPVRLVERELLRRGPTTAEDLAALRRGVAAEIDAAVEFGKRGPPPTLEAALSAVYAPHARAEEPSGRGGPTLSFVQALNQALAQEMERDPTVFLMGEDVGETGGIFQVTKGLVDRFGEERVRDTPITEAAFVGCGIGAALTGHRPVVEIQVVDFAAVAMDMLANQAAKLRFMLGGNAALPLVIRAPNGGGIRLAAQHSQSLEAWFAHVPGLVVIGPSTPYDAKGLLLAALRDDNPVVFLESKLLYLSAAGPVPEAPYVIPIGKGDVKREGTDVTVVATMGMVPRALAAAAELAREGISVEVVDPRTLRPLDEELILESVRKTNRLVVAHEACTDFGFGAQVASVVSSKAFDWLDAPIVRVGAPAMPVPYADELENLVIPSAARIAGAVRDALAGRGE